MLRVFEAFSMAARAAVTQAHQEARMHGSDYIGTEHLLLGLLGGEQDSAVADALDAFNVAPDAVRARVEDSIGPACEPQPGHLPFSPRAKAALERTRDETEARGRHSVQPSHVLAALMLDGQSAAAKTVRSLGIQPVAVRDRLLSRD